MKKILFSLVFLFSVSLSWGQAYSYTYKPLSKVGCSVSYFVTSNNGQMVITIQISSDEGLCFLDNPTLMVRFGNDSVAKISGTNMGLAPTSSSSSGFVVGNTVYSGGSSGTGRAMFAIPDAYIPYFRSGISKIRLSTTPFTHERTFRIMALGDYYDSEEVDDNNIGFRLYNAFIEEKEKEENF